MEKPLKITTGRSLSATIDAIMKENIKQSLQATAAEEAERQKLMGEEDDDIFDDSGSDAGSDEKQPAASKTVDAEKEKLKKGDVTAADVVEKLNTIRSGKSFKDETISAKLDEYVGSLTKPEKTALLAFLKGLAQIVTGEVPVDQTIDPGDKPADIKMKKGDSSEKQSKSIKPNVIKAPPKEKAEKKPSSEDTSGPVPITPKKAK